MERTFIVDATEYTVSTCTAIAASIGDTERQEALFVESYDGEKTDFVVFGWEMPEDIESFNDMCDDFGAWDAYYETIETVVLL